MDSQPDIDARDLFRAVSMLRAGCELPREHPSFTAIANAPGGAGDAEVPDGEEPGALTPTRDALRRWEHFRSERSLYLRAALRLLGSLEDAEDLVQDVGLRILRHPSGPRDDARLRAWCYGMVRNAALDFRRSAARQRRGQHVELDHTDGIIDSTVVAPDVDVDAWRVLGEGAELDEVERELLVRRFVLEQTASEIAVEFRVSPPAVRMKLKRLLARIRGFLMLVS